MSGRALKLRIRENRMARIGKVALIGLAALGLLYVVSWLQTPTPAQRETLAKMSQAEPTPAGSNAFVDAWTIDYDLDAAERARIARADVARYDPTRPQASSFTPGVAEGKQSQDLAYLDERLCVRDGGSCLQRVQQQRASIQALLQPHAGLLARTRAVLEKHDYLASPFPPGPGMPMLVQPVARGSALIRTQAALDFDAGRQGDALAATCRLVDGWRKWLRAPEFPVDQMIGTAEIATTLELQASMLAQMPADAPRIAECDNMRNLPVLEKSASCRVAKGELRLQQVFVAFGDYANSDPSPARRQLHRALVRPENTLAAAATELRPACEDAFVESLRADVRVPSPTRFSMWQLQCVANLAGCLKLRAPASLPTYQRQLQDYRARMKVMATLWWLRDTAGDTRALADRLADRPQALRQGRPIELVDGRLQIEQFDRAGSLVWSVPLPAGSR